MNLFSDSLPTEFGNLYSLTALFVFFFCLYVFMSMFMWRYV